MVPMLDLIGNNSTVVLADGVPAVTRALSISGLHGVTVSDLAIDGNRANQSNGGAQDGGNHGLSIEGGNDITLANVSISDCYNDGLFVGPLLGQEPTDITATNVTVDNSRRNGLSIIAARRARFYDSSFGGSNGTAPQAGVDIEPNQADEVVEDIQFHRCSFDDNAYRGFVLQVREAGARDVGLFDCTMDGNNLDAEADGFDVRVTKNSTVVAATVERFTVDSCTLATGTGASLDEPGVLHLSPRVVDSTVVGNLTISSSTSPTVSGNTVSGATTIT